MGLFRWQAILGLVTFLSVAPATLAQNNPRIGYVYPAGGQQGATFQVMLGGQYLDGAANVYVSGAGVQATVVEYNKPLTSKELSLLKEKLKELQEKKSAATKNSEGQSGQDRSQTPTNPVWTAEDEKMLAEVRKKLSNPPNRQGNPAIAETVTLQVTMAPDAEPGKRELKLGTQLGVSNPLVFCVDQLPEFSGKTAISSGESRIGMATKSIPAETEMNIALPAIVNGQIMPGEVDLFRFKARKGEQLVVAARARELIPYLADAVPGWFQATLAIYDAKGNELAYDDDYRFNPDPVLHYEIPNDGEYVIEIKDSIYRGREDFVYRIALGELPFVTSIFPLGGQAGAQTTIEVQGWNLPVDRLTMDDKDKGPGIYPVSVRDQERISNPVPFAVDTLPECLEQESNNQPGNAQPVTLPIIVNGRIDKPGDWDVFRFEGRTGDKIVAEVYARRLGSPLDSVLKLTDATGSQLAFNDDREDKGAGLTTHHADSWLCATLPADGTYYLHMGDTQHKGGAEYGYRLRISPPQPDFELRVVPSSINIRAGASIPMTVYALRKDGFSDEIALVLKDLPRGFSLRGVSVPAQQDKVRLTLTAPPMPLEEPISLHMEGRATIQGREVFRPAVPAEDMMQAFSYRHLVPAKDLKVAVTGRWRPIAAAKILSETPVRIPAGGTALVRISAPINSPAGQVKIELNEPPDGIAIRNVSAIRQGMEIVLQSDAAKVKPGLKGNLIFNASVVKSPESKNEKVQGNKGRIQLGTLPAIPFEIIESLPSGP